MNIETKQIGMKLAREWAQIIAHASVEDAEIIVHQIQNETLNRAADVCHKAGGDWQTNIECQNAILAERSRSIARENELHYGKIEAEREQLMLWQSSLVS
jgi:hypothetical protein